MEKRASLSSDDGESYRHTPKALSNGHSGNLSHQINLKKLAQSKSSRVSFSSTPDRVFETYSKVDYERKDDGSDPLSASLVFEMEKLTASLDRHEIILTKGAEGLGFSISGMGFGENLGPEDKLSIYVKEIVSNGVAGKDGRMRTGDQIIDVNGLSMIGITYREAVAILRGASGKVRLVLGRRPPEDGSNRPIGSPEQRGVVRVGLATSPTEDRSPNGRLEVNQQLRSIGDGNQRTLRRMDTPKHDSSSSDEDEKKRRAVGVNVDHSPQSGAKAMVLRLELAAIERAKMEKKLQDLRTEIGAGVRQQNAEIVFGRRSDSKEKVKLSAMEDSLIEARNETLRYKNLLEVEENHRNDLERKLHAELLNIKESHSRDLSIVNDLRLKESRYENEKRELMKRMSDTDQKYEKRIRELTQKLSRLEVLYQAKFGGNNSHSTTTTSHTLISTRSLSNEDQTDGIKIREKDSSDSASDDEKRKSRKAALPVITASSTALAPMLKTHSREVTVHGSVDNHTISGDIATKATVAAVIRKKHGDSSSESDNVPPEYAPPPIPDNEIRINGSLARRTSKDSHSDSDSDREDPSKTRGGHRVVTSVSTKSEVRTKDSSSDDEGKRKASESGKRLVRTEAFEISVESRGRRSSSDEGENRRIGAEFKVKDVPRSTQKSHTSESSDEGGISKIKTVEHGDRLGIGGSLVVERVQKAAGESSDEDERVRRAVNATITVPLVRQESFKASERLVDGGDLSSGDERSRMMIHGAGNNRDGLNGRDKSAGSDSSDHHDKSPRSGGEVKSKKKSGGIFGRKKKKENNISHDSSDDDDDDNGTKKKSKGKGKKKKTKKNKHKDGESSDDSSDDEDAKNKKKKSKGKAEKKSKTKIKRSSVDSSHDAAVAGAMAAAIGMEYHGETPAPAAGVQSHQSSAPILPIPTISEAEFTTMERVRRESHRSSRRTSNASLSSANSTSKDVRRLAAHGHHRDSSDSGNENRRKTWNSSLEVDAILDASIRPWNSTPNIGASSALVVSSGRNDSGEADRWTKQEVITWLATINLMELTDVFERHDIDGPKLFAMTSKSYKEMEITGKNRDVLKKQIKELQKAVSREKKLRAADAKKREKEFKAQEKLRKKERTKLRTRSESSSDETDNEEHGKDKKKKKLGRHKDKNLHAGDLSHSDDSSDEDHAKGKKKNKSKGKAEKKKSKSRIKRSSVDSSQDAAVAGAMAAAIGMEYHGETAAAAAAAGVQVHQSSTSIVQVPFISQAEFDSMDGGRRESHRSSDRLSKDSLSSADSATKAIRRAADQKRRDSSDSDDDNRRKTVRRSLEVDTIIDSSIRPWSSTPNVGASSGLVVSFGHERQSSGLNDFKEADRWTRQEVITWLATINLMELTDVFERHDIDGPKLFAMTSKSYKEMEITGKNRDILKKQIKELQKAVSREKKLRAADAKKREKEFKAQEKLRKKEQKKNRGALSHDESEDEGHGKDKKKKKIGRHKDKHLHAGDLSHSDDSSDEDHAKGKKKKKSKGKAEKKKSKTRIKRASVDSSQDAAVAGAMAAAIGMEYHGETTAAAAAGVQVHQSSTSIVQVPFISQAEFDAMERDSIGRDVDERSVASGSSADSAARRIRHSVAENSEGGNRLHSWTSAIEVANSVETGFRPWSSTPDVNVGAGLVVSSIHVRTSSGRNDSAEADLWTRQEVMAWLMTLHLDQLIYAFERRGVDGRQLLAMTNDSFKEMEIAGKDKDLLKKKIKELSQAVTKAEKLRKKEERQREKAFKAQVKLRKTESARKVSASSS